MNKRKLCLALAMLCILSSIALPALADICSSHGTRYEKETGTGASTFSRKDADVHNVKTLVYYTCEMCENKANWPGYRNSTEKHNFTGKTEAGHAGGNTYKFKSTCKCGETKIIYEMCPYGCKP